VADELADGSSLRAVEEQLRLLQRIDRSRSQLRTTGAVLWGQEGADASFRGVLEVAAPYAWAWQVCEIIELTAATVPAWTLRAEDLVTPAGFSWFAHPLPLLNPYAMKKQKGNASGSASTASTSGIPSFRRGSARLAGGAGAGVGFVGGSGRRCAR
jgi:hypothetical protein